MRKFQFRGQSKVGAHLARSDAKHRRIDSNAESLATGRFKPLNQLPGKRSIFLEVELEPEWTFCHRGQFLDCYCRVGTDNNRSTHCPSPTDGRQFSVRMHHALIGNRCQQNRCCQLATEKRGTWVDGSNAAEHARQEKNLFKGSLIDSQADIITG